MSARAGCRRRRTSTGLREPEDADRTGHRHPFRSCTTRGRSLPGSLYACLRGEHFDGHTFAADAVRSGATALLADHPLDLASERRLDVAGRRRSSSTTPGGDWARSRPRWPVTRAERWRPSGITGTNGKTTTAALMAAIFEDAGRPCGVVGTLHGLRTTPEAPELQSVLREFVASRQVGRGARGVVARTGDAPRRRHRIRCRGVHQSRPRPPRPARLAGGVLPCQGPALLARVLPRSAWSTSTTPTVA